MKIYTLGLILLLATGLSGFAQEGPRNEGRESKDGDRSRMFDELSEEERQKVRASLSEVWNDPAVLQARDEVRRATEAYQKAMKAAIESKDPEVAKILGRMKREESMRGGPGPGPGAKGEHGKGRRSWGGGEKSSLSVMRMIEGGPFVEKLNDEQKAIYSEAQAEAVKSEKVRTLLAELAKMRAGDEERRSRRVVLIDQIRTAFYNAAVEADARVKEFLPDGLPKPKSEKKPKPEKVDS